MEIKYTVEDYKKVLSMAKKLDRAVEKLREAHDEIKTYNGFKIFGDCLEELYEASDNYNKVNRKLCTVRFRQQNPVKQNFNDRYFYSIELDENGKKRVHLFGNIYDNNDGTETNYRVGEWKFLYQTIEDIVLMADTDTFGEWANNESFDALDDITEAKAIETANKYFDGNPGTELYIGDLTEDTPCGDYWWEV